MSKPFIVSRRNAALAIAGTLASSAGPAAAAVNRLHDARLPADASDRDLLEAGHMHVMRLLKAVRRAQGSAERAEAFERCKTALRVHDLSEASFAASRDAAPLRAPGSLPGLYRHVDASGLLTRVIVRELDAWPKTDVGWLERFGDLEAAFAMHVTDQ